MKFNVFWMIWSRFYELQLGDILYCYRQNVIIDVYGVNVVVKV